MDKIKICLVFGHFQFSDGVCRSAVAIANLLSRKKNVQVDLIPLYRFEKEALILVENEVCVRPVFRTYFKGFSKLLSYIPNKILYKFIIRKKYNIEVAFQCDVPTKIMSASTNKNAKHFVWMHGYDNGLVDLNFYKKFDKLITVSKCNAERFSRESNKIMSVDYSYNPIDEKIVIQKGKESVDFPNNNLLKFIAVGRLSPEKGFDRLIQVCKRLHNEGFNFLLYIVGDGPMRLQLRELAKDDTNIIMLGAQSNPHKYTSKCDLLICSSFSEGYSTVCVEAIMLGVPVLSTSVSGAEEIIADACAGSVIGMNDEELYLGIKQVLENPSIISEWRDSINDNKFKFAQEYRAMKLYKILGLDNEEKEIL